ncbi:dienelactone hydrolase family protein [Bacillus spongiae]|uniref:Dienelactone hydrolase family protein n=1 Tax=Bacillus spongiae TaxID=2683610 RepID=A0ABU8HC28_9BACI
MNKHTIPYKLYPVTDADKRRTIVLYHGWGSSVASYDNWGKSLSAKGFQVVIPELLYHDTRSPLQNYHDKSVLNEYFWKAVFWMIDEAREFLLPFYEKREDIILIGSSFGGFIASGIFSSIPYLGGLVNINGTGAFCSFENNIRAFSGEAPLSGGELQKFLTYDPLEKRVNKAPILLLHGDLDSVIPIQSKREYEQYLRRSTDTVNFITYKDVNHTITLEMEQDLFDWLERHYER